MLPPARAGGSSAPAGSSSGAARGARGRGRRTSEDVAHKIVNALHAPRLHQEADEHEELVGALRIRLVKEAADNIETDDAVRTESASHLLAVNDNETIDFGQFLRIKKGHGHAVDFSNDRFPILHATSRSLLWLILGPPAARGNKLIISHSSVFRVALDGSMAFAAIISVIIAPLELGFDLYADHRWLETTDHVCTGLFILDLLASFITTYEDAKVITSYHTNVIAVTLQRVRPPLLNVHACPSAGSSGDVTQGSGVPISARLVHSRSDRLLPLRLVGQRRWGRWDKPRQDVQATAVAARNEGRAPTEDASLSA